MTKQRYDKLIKLLEKWRDESYDDREQIDIESFQIGQPISQWIKCSEWLPNEMNKWMKSSICTPNWPFQIVICNLYHNEMEGPLKKRYFTCNSIDFKQILGTHDMIDENTYWMPLLEIPND